jgi:hypothetical protein
MSVQEWGIVIGVVTSALLSLAPWMFMVHAKLAVLVTRIDALSEKVDIAAEASGELWSLCAQHEARLETHDVQLSHIAKRLEEWA